jgi:hypothetical protein
LKGSQESTRLDHQQRFFLIFGSFSSILSPLTEAKARIDPAMGARNQVDIGLSYRPANLCSLATQFQTRFLESIPRPIAERKFSTRLWSKDQCDFDAKMCGFNFGRALTI